VREGATVINGSNFFDGLMPKLSYIILHDYVVVFRFYCYIVQCLVTIGKRGEASHMRRISTYPFRREFIVLVVVGFIHLNFFSLFFLGESLFHSNPDYEVTLSPALSGNSIQPLNTGVTQEIVTSMISPFPSHKSTSLIDSAACITIISLNKYPQWSKSAFT
jgi:hypothetical protein